MPSGRVDRQRRRPDRATPRRTTRTRRTGIQRITRRPGRATAARSRPKSSTGGAFRLSSTRRAALLAILVCAMALSVSVPLRTYLSQRAELSATEQQRAVLTREVLQLRERNRQLSDPAAVEAEARSRLGYVKPGETPYVVDIPPPASTPPPAPPPHDVPWYQQIWDTLTGAGQ